MLRAQVFATFSVAAGEIQSEGLYEGAPVFAPYFYAEYRRGRKALRVAHRNADLLAVTYLVTEDDRAAFPELAEVVEVHLFVDTERALEFVALDPVFRRLGGRPPNVEEDEDEADDEG